MHRVALLLILFATGCATRPAVRGDLHALLSRYESYGFSGTVLVVKDGRVVLHEGYGFADRERGIRNGPRTLYEVGSLNKTFTAAAILQLEARGKLSTSDPLSRHLGPFPPAKATATIHHLATHTAGIGSGRAIPLHQRRLQRPRRDHRRALWPSVRDLCARAPGQAGRAPRDLLPR